MASFINDELNDWIELNSNNAELHFLRSVICDDMLNQKCKALFEIMKAEECSPNIALRFQMFSMKAKIRKELLQEDIKKESNSRNSFSRVVRYYEMLTDEQNCLMEAIDKYEEFWEEMKLPHPVFKKFIDIICAISELNEKIKNNVKSIQSISSGDIKATVMYSLYLKMVEEDYFGANEQYAKYKSQFGLGRNAYDDIETRYGSASYIGVVMVSGSKIRMGKIINSNQEIIDSLGYKKEEIVDCNVNILMPSITGQFHNELIEKFYDKSIQLMRLAYTEKLQLAMHKLGYLVPIKLMFRMTQNFNQGIMFLGFISSSKVFGDLRLGDENLSINEAYIFLLGKDNSILGFNKEFAQLFSPNIEDLNIKRYLNKDHKIDIAAYLPDAFKTENESHAFDHLGLQMDADLNPLIEVFDTIIKENRNKESLTAEETKLQIQWERSVHDICKNNFIIKISKVNKQLVDYNVLTLMNNNHRSTFIEANNNKITFDDQYSNQKQKEGKSMELLHVDDKNSVSATTSSSIYFYQYHNLKSKSALLKTSSSPSGIKKFPKL